MTRVRFHLSRRRRQRVEALIAHLVDLLDAADGDPDMEPETDEDTHDAEDDQADREPGADDVPPSLWPVRIPPGMEPQPGHFVATVPAVRL